MRTLYIWVMIVSVPTFLAMPTNTVPALPTPTVPQTCKLDLSDELFGGVKFACEGNNLDRSRCCPVLAAWMFAAHARSALTVVPETKVESPAGFPIKPEDDSQVCVRSLQDALQKRGINIHNLNASCDVGLCFCGIRLHKVSSLACPAAFRLNSTSRTMTPTATVRDLERKCVNSSNAGCTRCLGALQKLKPSENGSIATERGKLLMGRDCELMGLTWLLARNRTAYIPTVSAVLRAIMYSTYIRKDHPECSAEQQNMPLAVDSLHLEKDHSPSPATMPSIVLILFCFLFYP